MVQVHLTDGPLGKPPVPGAAEVVPLGDLRESDRRPLRRPLLDVGGEGADVEVVVLREGGLERLAVLYRGAIGGVLLDAHMPPQGLRERLLQELAQTVKGDPLSLTPRRGDGGVETAHGEPLLGRPPHLPSQERRQVRPLALRPPEPA